MVSGFGFERKVGHVLLFWQTTDYSALFFFLSNTVKNIWTGLKWYLHLYCLKLLRSESDLIVGLFHTPLILSKAMQSLVINTRTGPITVKLFVTLHHLTQERGKGCTGWATAPPHQAFPWDSYTSPSSLSQCPLPTNTSWFSPVDCCSSRCRVPKQIPAFPRGDVLCTVHQGWMFSTRPGTAVLNTRRLPPAARKAGGKQFSFTPCSQHLTARY